MLDGLSTGEQGAIVTSIGFLVLVGLSLVPRLREIGLTRAVKMSLSWIVIFGGLVLVVSQWTRIRGAIDPASPVSVANEVRVNARDDGHFYVRASINGKPVLFMVDTGASDIVLTTATAERIGIDVASLPFGGVAETANGLVRTAGVELDVLEVGTIRLQDVPASVNEGNLSTNLLGMRFMNSLDSWRVEQGALILVR